MSLSRVSKSAVNKDSKRMEERHVRDNNAMKRRYGLRSSRSSFWSINWEDSDEEHSAMKKKSPKKRGDSDDADSVMRKKSPKKSWADQCEEYFKEKECPMESPNKQDRNLERRNGKQNKAKKSLQNYFNWTDRQEAIDEDEPFPERLLRKRERNVDDSPTPKSGVSNHPDFVKRRLRAGSDGVSTTSSSINSSDTEEGAKTLKKYETNPVVLSRRQKQIDYGKNTKAYKMYLQSVPKGKREDHHIVTPKKHLVYSRRSWDNQIKIWRKRLHQYDPESDEEEDDADLSDMIAMSPK